MSSFNDFIQLELPKRPFTDSDGADGQILIRSTDPNKPRELIWEDPSTIINTYTQSEIDGFLSNKSNIDHTHDSNEILNTSSLTGSTLNDALVGLETNINSKGYVLIQNEEPIEHTQNTIWIS